MFARLFRKAGAGLCGPGQLPIHGIHRILVCRPNHRLGNSVLISPLIQEIERLYPGAEIDLLASDAAAELFSCRFRVRRVFPLPAKAARHLLRTLRLLWEMRAAHYDLAIDMSLGSHSGRLALALARSRYKLGFPDGMQAVRGPWAGYAWPSHHAQRAVLLLRSAFAGPIVEGAYPALDVGLYLGGKE